MLREPHSGTIVVINAWDDLCRSMLDKMTGSNGNYTAVSPELGLKKYQPFKLVLVCGCQISFAETYSKEFRARVIEMPHPTYHEWNPHAIAMAGRFIREGRIDLELRLNDGWLFATPLVPF